MARWLMPSVVLALGCSGEVGLERPPNQLTLRSPVGGVAATRHLGEDCKQHGRAACLSSECLHVGFETTTRYVCSKRCGIDEDCPLEWNCTDTLPGGAHRFCIPRVDEGGRPATPRPAPTGAP